MLFQALLLVLKAVCSDSSDIITLDGKKFNLKGVAKTEFICFLYFSGIISLFCC